MKPMKPMKARKGGYAFLFVVAITMFLFAQSSPAATITQLTGLGDFTSPIIASNDFESVIDTPEFTFDATASLITAGAASSGVTTSGVRGLAEFPDNFPLVATLSSDAVEVGLFFGNDESSVFDVILSVFDSGNVLLGTVTVQSNANDFVDQFIGLRSDTVFRRVEISYQNVGLAVFIDDFTVGISPIPEPSTLLLLGTGLVGLVGYSRRKRRA